MSQFPQNPYDDPVQVPIPVKPVGTVTPPGVYPPGYGPSAGLRSVSLGLKLVYYAIVELIVVFVLILIGGVAVTFLNFPPPPPGLLPLITVGFFINLLVVWITTFVGKCFCTSVPRGSGAKGLMIATIVLESVYAMSVIFAFLMTMMWTFQRVPPNGFFQQVQFLGVLQLLGALAGIAAYFCFLTFISSLGKFMERHDVRRFAITVIITNILFSLPWGRCSESLESCF